MATADQVKALVQSFLDKDESRFYATALQVAAKEEKQGHSKFASELRRLVDSRDVTAPQKSIATKFRTIRKASDHASGSFNVEDLLHLTHTDTRLSDMVMSDDCSSHINRTIMEHRQRHRLSKFALHPRRKLLLTGPPGTGKTLTAKVLATELKLPLYTLQFDGLISRYLGETAAKLRMVFDHIASSKAVYLFDEFDAIGAMRSKSNDVGEIRRVLNSFLQFFEEDHSESLIICATNHPEMLDKALFRRFDDIIEFKKPGVLEMKRFIENRLFLFDLKCIDLDKVCASVTDLSYADLGQACDDAAKNSVLYNDGIFTEDELSRAITYRSVK
ncbi:MAG: AAA family ATPase [Candidatus Reddybacter sp.]